MPSRACDDERPSPSEGCYLPAILDRDAAAEPGHAARRADRPPGSWSRVREPRVPPRRARPHPPSLQREAVDRVPATVPRLAPLAADATGLTELFFLDEVTAFAAGHRPCALCRREDYVRLVELWRELHPDRTGADAIDAQLHVERLDTAVGTQRHHEAPLDELPDGAFVLRDGEPHLLLAAELLRWAPGGYEDRTPRPIGERVTVVTPPSLVALLRPGWRPPRCPRLGDPRPSASTFRRFTSPLDL